MRTHIVLITIAIVCLTLNSPLLAAIRKVPLEYPTIQAAIDDCNDGDIVIIAPGTYTGPGNRDIDFKGKVITVRSTDPEDPCVVTATVIDCQNVSGHRGFYFHSGEGPDSVVCGLTITGGNAAGGGIYCVDSSPTISRCIITGNRTRDGSDSYGFSGFAGNGEDGGGVYCNGSFSVIENSVIMWNRTGNGGTAYSRRSRPDDEPALQGGDGGRGGGVFCYNSVLVIANCVIAGNVTGNGGDCGKPLNFCEWKGGDGGGGGGICALESSAVFINNCTIAGNETGAGGVAYGYGCFNGNRGVGGGVCCDASTLEATNGIIWGNSPSQIEGSTIVVNYSDIEGGWPGVGIINADPCFVNAGGGDYHLPSYSPCVNAGDPGYSPVPGETDIDGEPRVVSGRIDMGADEGLYETPLILLSATEFIVYAFEGGSNPADLVLSIRNWGSGILNWEIMEDCPWVQVDPNNGESAGEPDMVAIRIDTTGLGWGQYSCELTIGDPCAANSPLRVEIRLMLRQLGILLVPSEYPTIKAGIDAAVDGDTVVVAEGTYTGVGNKNLDYGGKLITLRSTDPNDPCVVEETVIDCQGSGRGFSFHHGEEPNSIVSGFTITNGYVSANGGGIICSSSSPTISNCIIRGNRALIETYSGGGIYSSGAPVIKGCTIEDNSGKDGGGIFCVGNTIISNCIIRNNVAEGWWYSPDSVIWWPMPGFGGGIYCYGSGTIIRNCVISGNDAAPHRHLPDYYHDGGGGGIYCSGSNKIINCLIYGNWGGGWNTVGSGGGGILFKGSVSTVENCTIADNLAYRGTGLFFYGGSATIINSIIWGNNIVDGSPEITFSDVQGGWPGEGNIDATPLFVTGPEGDYYLSQIAAGQVSDSPCVDAGSDTAVNLGMHIYTTRTDELGDKGIVDMGYHYPAIIEYGNPDMDGDGDVDFFDYAWLSLYLSYDTSKQIPRGSVVVDGDLGDWPGSVELIVLDKVYTGSPNDVADARFALQWDDATNKVYAAVVVNDTSHVFLDEYVNWDASDRIEIYSQGDAEGGTGWYRIYDAAQQYCVAPDTIGGNWATWALGETLEEDVGLEYAVRIVGNFIIYEVGVRMFDNYGGFSGTETLVTDLHAGHVVGFDILASTRRDTVNFGMLSENLMTGKYKDAGKFASYILVDETVSADLDGNGAKNYADLGILVESWLDCLVTKARNPQPANEARGVDPNVTLSWVPGVAALYHDVYFGTDAEAVANAGHLSPEFMGTFSDTNFDPCGLDCATIYYWRIDEVGPACTVQGVVWNFTTQIGLIGWWKFDEGEGSIAYDSAGENDGTIHGPTWTAGQINSALSFDGVDDYVNIPYDASLDIDASEGITLSVWIKLNSYPTDSDSGPIFGLFDSKGAGTKNHLAIGRSINGNPISWDQYPPSGGGITSIKPDLDKWYHVAVVQDSSYRAIYINGTLDVSDNIPESYQGNIPDTIRIGNRADLAPFYFHGTIDDIRIYDKALSAEEIWQLYQDGLN